jgi:hypothetical protein
LQYDLKSCHVGKSVLIMRKTFKWSLTAGLILPLCGIAYSVSADDGQISSWKDSKFLDYPPPPEGGWEPLVPVYNSDKANADSDNDNSDNDNRRTTNTTNQSATASPPAQYAPQAGTAYTTRPPPPTSVAPVAPGYAPSWPPAVTPVAPGYPPSWPPAVAPGFNRGFAQPGFNRPAYPAAGYGRPGLNRGAPAYNLPGAAALPGNNGNPWNDGHPGGWAATPWGESGPAGWVYPVNDATAKAQNGAPMPSPALTAPNNMGDMSGGFNAPTASSPNSADVAGQNNNSARTAPAPVNGFNWNVQ